MGIDLHGSENGLPGMFLEASSWGAGEDLRRTLGAEGLPGRRSDAPGVRALLATPGLPRLSPFPDPWADEGGRGQGLRLARTQLSALETEVCPHLPLSCCLPCLIHTQTLGAWGCLLKSSLGPAKGAPSSKLSRLQQQVGLTGEARRAPRTPSWRPIFVKGLGLAV